MYVIVIHKNVNWINDAHIRSQEIKFINEYDLRILCENCAKIPYTRNMRVLLEIIVIYFHF